jgi:hypothetical protein
MVRITGVRLADPLRTDARRQPEAGQVGGEEGDNLSDASVQQREDVEAAGNVRPGGVVPQVGAERDLAVGCGGQEPPARSQRAADQEGADLVLAAISLGQRRHRVARIVGEHRDDRVDVADVPGVGQRAAMSSTAASPRSRSTVCWVGAAEPIALRALSVRC